MTTDTSRGFTVIEVMLFLAITGGLFAALMIGVGAAVTQQRYLDSVRSYMALIQNQYAEVLTTRNTDVDDWKCSDDKNGSVTNEDGDGSREGAPGTSRCVILGRAIQIKNDGKSVVLSSVTGYDPTQTLNDLNGNSVLDNAEMGDSNDLTALSLYQPKLATFDSEMVDIDWDAEVVTPLVNGNRSASAAIILILRSPTTGVVKVLTSQSPLGDRTDLSSEISQAIASAPAVLRVCIDGDSGMLPKQMVLVDPRVAGADAVTSDGGQNEECQS